MYEGDRHELWVVPMGVEQVVIYLAKVKLKRSLQVSKLASGTLSKT